MVISRDNPAFLASAVICGLWLHYFPRGIDYFPSPEMCMVNGYGLLATALAAYVLRPRNRFAQRAILLAIALSIHTIASLAGRISLFAGLAESIWASGYSGYFLLFKGSLPIFDLIGLRYYVAEFVFSALITGAVFCVSARGFSQARYYILALAFVGAFVLAMLPLFLVATLFPNNIQFAQPGALFMILYTILFWQLIPYLPKNEIHVVDSKTMNNNTIPTESRLPT